MARAADAKDSLAGREWRNSGAKSGEWWRAFYGAKYGMLLDLRVEVQRKWAEMADFEYEANHSPEEQAMERAANLAKWDVVLTLAEELADVQERGQLFQRSQMSMVEENHGLHNLAWLVVRYDITGLTGATGRTKTVEPFFLSNAPPSADMIEIISKIAARSWERWPRLLRRATWQQFLATRAPAPPSSLQSQPQPQPQPQPKFFGAPGGPAMSGGGGRTTPSAPPRQFPVRQPMPLPHQFPVPQPTSLPHQFQMRHPTRRWHMISHSLRPKNRAAMGHVGVGRENH
jgi:hypothetical protein